MSYSRTTDRLLTLGLAIAATGISCRNPQRKLPEAAAAGTVVVQLDNLDTPDRNQPGYIYLLGSCIPNVTGVFNAGLVSFTADGIHNGLSGCSMQIKTSQPLAGAKFASGADQTVLYNADLSTFYLDANGAIAAVAPLNKLYSTGDTALGGAGNEARPSKAPTGRAGSSAVTITPHTGTP